MKFEDRRSLEFKALQDEMLENSRKIYQIITSTIALCAGLIGYCFSTAHFTIVWTRPFALLSPFLILVPAMILIQSNQLSTVRIAGFLKVVFEEEDRELPGWQTAMQWCRQKSCGPDRTKAEGRATGKDRWNRYVRRARELTFVVEPEKSDGRHLHAGLRGILSGTAFASNLGSAVAWWWLLHHDHIWSHPHVGSMIFWYLVSLSIVWWGFALAYRDMREGWDNNRFKEWQGHWRLWVKSVEDPEHL